MASQKPIPVGVWWGLGALAVVALLVNAAQNRPDSDSESNNSAPSFTYTPYVLRVHFINDRSIDASFYGAGDTEKRLFAVDCPIITVPAHGSKTQECYGSKPSRPMTDPDPNSPWNGAYLRYDVAWYKCPGSECKQEGETEAFSYSNVDSPTFEVRLTAAANPEVRWVQDGLSSSASTAPGPPRTIHLAFRDDTGRTGYTIGVAIYPYSSVGAPAHETWTGSSGQIHDTARTQVDLRATVYHPDGRTGGQLFACVTSTGADAEVRYILQSNPSSRSGYTLVAERDGVRWETTPC